MIKPVMKPANTGEPQRTIVNSSQIWSAEYKVRSKILPPLYHNNDLLKFFPILISSKVWNWIIWNHLSSGVSHPFSASLEIFHILVYHVDRTCDRASFWCLETYCWRWVFHGTPSTKPRKRSGLRATIKRRWLSYLPARIFAAAFSTGKILSFSSKPNHFQYRCWHLMSTTIMRYRFPAQRLATWPWIKRPSIRHPTTS